MGAIQARMEGRRAKCIGWWGYTLEELSGLWVFWKHCQQSGVISDELRVLFFKTKRRKKEE